LIDGSAAFVAWLGAALIVLADGRRGLALGVALATVGLAVIAGLNAGLAAAAVLAVGGALAALGRLRAGTGGWAVMPPGSTPRLILCVATALIALWIALGITSGESAALRFAVLSAIGLAGARVLSSVDPDVQLTAVAVLAVAIGCAAGLGGADVWPCVAAALVAAGAGWLPLRSAPRAA
jgi:hypothetical protein